MSITDEQLVEIQGWLRSEDGYPDGVDGLYRDTSRLIAALKAERAAVALVIEEMLTERSNTNTLRIQNGDLRAEIERLKKIINEYRSRVVSYRVDYK